MKKLLLLLVLWAGIGFKAAACSCPYHRSFCISLPDSADGIVVSGIITSFHSSGTLNLKLKVLEVLRGNETRDTITIWKDKNLSCPPGEIPMTVENIGYEYQTTDLPEVGDTIITSIRRITQSNITNSWDVIGEYRRPRWLCESTSLRVVNGFAIGKVYGNEFSSYGPFQSIAYQDFISEWDNGEFECKTVIGKEDELAVQSLQVFPNPATDKVYLHNPTNQSGTVIFYDIAGRVMLQRPFSGVQEPISVSELSQGLYVVTITGNEGGQWQQKLLIQP